MLRALLPRSIKNRVKGVVRRARRAYVGLFRSYGPSELEAALRSLGVEPGDSVMVHSSFEPHHGFRGSADEAVDVFCRVVGTQGTVLMPSQPYHSSSLQYLRKGRAFDVRRTPSAMGLVSEYFRRRPGVMRSAHPTHPVLALGRRAEWFICDHELSLHPCGPNTPFGRLADARGKVAFFNVPFAFFTFFHHLEHRVASRLPFALYHEPPFEVHTIDASGREMLVTTLVFSEEAIRRRRFSRLEEWLVAEGVIRSVSVGASRLLLVDVSTVVDVVENRARHGEFFYDLGGA